MSVALHRKKFRYAFAREPCVLLRKSDQTTYIKRAPSLYVNEAIGKSVDVPNDVLVSTRRSPILIINRRTKKEKKEEED